MALKDLQRDKDQYRPCLENIKVFLILPFCTCRQVTDKGERLAQLCSLDAILIDSLVVHEDMQAALDGCS